MKKYYLNIPYDLYQEIGSVREQYDIINYLLVTMNFLNAEQYNKVEEEKSNLIIFVDKVSRLFLKTENKVHSIQYPFLLKEEEGCLTSFFQGVKIDSKTIIILSVIIDKKEYFIKSIDDMVDTFLNTMGEFEVSDRDYIEFCWTLLIFYYLLKRVMCDMIMMRIPKGLI